jgi:glycosyltransferase involved in cell wall biosynthesis
LTSRKKVEAIARENSNEMSRNAIEETQQISALSAFISKRGKKQLETPLRLNSTAQEIAVALLTGGGDKPYALGIATGLSAHGTTIDFIGSNDLDVPELRRIASLNFLNLRGDHRTDVSFFKKTARVVIYYLRLARYALTARPKIFHILWNNKFEFFDRTLLLLYYKVLGKRIVFTAHNVNARKRDSKDTHLNRVTLRIQYHLADQIFVHTEGMRRELLAEFGVPRDKVAVIPFGINNTLPCTSLTSSEAKQRFGIAPHQKTILFFGNITPYKGLEHLVIAFASFTRHEPNCRLLIAGRTKGPDQYWRMIQQQIAQDGLEEQIIQRIEYIPDEEVEVYFKAADVIVLPYTYICQSGVLFLAYSFGLPVIASDVGSMKEDIIEGRTGFVCRPADAESIAETMRKYFESNVFMQLEERRPDIKEFANNRYSWERVVEITRKTYGKLLGSRKRGQLPTN